MSAIRTALSNAAEPGAREQAALALAGDPSAAAVLRQTLEKDASPMVRVAALQSLAHLKDSESGAIVAQLLADPSAPAAVRLAAARHAPAFSLPAVKALSGLLEKTAPAPLRLAAIASLDRMKAAREPLRQLLRDGATADKLAAIKALREFADRELTADFLAARQDGALRQAALLALAATPDLRAVPAYLDGLALSDPAAAQASRVALAKLGTEALAAIAPLADSIPPTVRGSLREVFKDDAAALKHPLFSQLQTTPTADYEKHAAEHPGDPVRGQAIYFGAAGTACIACHQVAGHGNSIGPDLTLAGKQFSRAEIVESILHPGRVVREGYQQFAVTTTDGREFTGSLKSDTGEGITLADLAGQPTLIPRTQIADRRALNISIMPEGLHAALTPEQFTDLIAFVASRRSDPRTEPAPPLPPGFAPLFNGTDLAGWRMTDINRRHWTVKDGRILHDGVNGDLWNETELGDFTLHVEWRWPDMPVLTNFPIITAEGHENEQTQRELDAGDSGIFLRGQSKAQANLFCYPVGSGEFWEFRSDRTQPPEFASTVTPSRRADAPVGDWNTMQIILKGNQASVILNGHEVIHGAFLPDLPAHGPVGFQHEHGRLEIRTVAVKRDLQ